MLFHYIKTNKNTNRLINYSQLDEQASIILHLNDPTKYNSASPLKFTSSRKHFLPPPISFHHCLSRRVFICNVSTVVIISSRSNRSPIYSAKGKMVTYNILNVLSRPFSSPSMFSRTMITLLPFGKRRGLVIVPGVSLVILVTNVRHCSPFSPSWIRYL